MPHHSHFPYHRPSSACATFARTSSNDPNLDDAPVFYQRKESISLIISIEGQSNYQLIIHTNMKFAAALLALFGSAVAFAPASSTKKTSALAFSIDTIPGALAPVGLFDPLGFAEKADEATLKRYREAELTHGRVAMLAVST